jgi:catechol 2,3-dioxygenase-like lactoylglutathione lyase family enzyme
LTHVALHVRDLDACIGFYADYCEMQVVHERGDPAGAGRVVWLAEPGRKAEFIFVLIAGGRDSRLPDGDFSHLGFAVDSRERVDAIAARAERAECLLWPAREEPYPVGYYCGVRDPDGNQVEFSYGQPLGPGAEGVKGERERVEGERE